MSTTPRLPELKPCPFCAWNPVSRSRNASGVLLYVGISLSTAGRLGQHRCTSAWSRKVATITIQRFSTRKAALEAERQAIQSEHPTHNVTGKLKGFRVTPSPAVHLTASAPDLRETPLERFFRRNGLVPGAGRVKA